MESNANSKQLIFTSDKPVLEDQLGTHKHLANLLVQIVRSKSDNPLVVGLFGGWGTGKSSVVKMYEQITKNNNIKNVYMDSWMFANAREKFGAGFLKSLADELLTNTLAKELIKTIDQRSETRETSHNIDTKTKLYLISIAMILLGLVALSVFWVGFNDEIRLNLMLFLIGVLVVNGLLEFVLPKIMTTSESRTIDESYNKVEHFKKKFQEIINKSSPKTISVVVDNIDRVEPSDALEMIRMLKTFVSEDVLGGKRFVLIVPCDEQELAKHIEDQLYVDDAHEFLRKFFSISLFIPELIHEDIVSFTKREFDVVYGGLFPSLTENDASIVSFVISRAARRSPRQVKVLINSFIGYWQGAGLVGTAGRDRGISALGAVVYVCLAYLRKGKELPKTFCDVFDNFAREDDVALRDFLISIREFQQYISDLEWSYLRRLQISDDERAIPNYVDINFAITDLDWEALDKLINDAVDLNDIISRLDIKVRESDSVSRERFIRWVLSLVANKTISTSSLPYRLRAYIDYIVTRPLNEWMNLVDEGLAEYIVQVEILPVKVVEMLTSLKEKIENGKHTAAQISYVTKLIYLTRTDYWINAVQKDELIRALDGLVYHCISENNDEFMEALLRNINVVYFEGTGVKLADTLANRYLNDGFRGMVVEDVFANVEKGNVGAYAFAAQWLKRTNLNQKDKLGQIHLIFQSIEALNALENPLLIKSLLLSPDQFSQFINDLENYCVKQIKQTAPGNIVPAVLAMSLIVSLTGKLGFQNQSTQARRSLDGQLLLGFANRFTQLSEDNKTKFIKHLDEDEKTLSYFQPPVLATLSQHNGLDILGRLSGNRNQFESVIGELIGLPHFGKAFNYWAGEKATKLQLLEEANDDIDLNSFFKMMEQKVPTASKYEEMVEGLKLLSKHKAAVVMIKNHVKWLIDKTSWTDKNSINMTVDKIIVLEKIVPIDNEIRNKFRDKLDIDILGLLSESSRTWVKNHLDQ